MKPIKDLKAVGDTLGIMSGTLKAPTEKTTQQINDAIDRVFAPNVSDAAWADFCLYASEEFLRKQWQAAHEMFITLKGDATLMRRLKKTKRLRLAWAAYAARAVLVSGTDMLRKGYTIDDEEVLVNRLEYDRNEELRQKMVVSLTGDMEVDLKTNFVARSISEQDLGTYLHFLEHLYCYSVEKMAQNIRIGLGAVTYMPQIPPNAFGIGKLFDELTHVERPKESNVWSKERRGAIYALYRTSQAWISAFTLPTTIQTVDGCVTSAVLPGIGLAATGYDTPDTASAVTPLHKAIQDKTNMLNNRPLKPMQLTEQDQERLRASWDMNAAIWGERRSISRTIAEAEKYRSLEKSLKRAEARQHQSQAAARLSAKQSEPTGKILAPGEVAIKQDELDRLRKKVMQQETQLFRQDAFQTERDETSAKLDDAAEEIERLRKLLEERDGEVQSLTEALLSEDEGEEDEAESAMTNLDIDALDGLKIVVAGGTPAFTKVLSQLHPGIRCFGTGRLPEDVIVHADVVWMQANCISHKYSWTVTDTCRKNNIPIRFFRTRSAQLGCAQMVHEIVKMRIQNLL